MAAFIGMVATGTPANLISLGAVDFGIVVDSTVIMMENVFRHLAAHGKRNASERILLAARRGRAADVLLDADHRRRLHPAVHADGVAGVIFSPMAHTYAFAIGGAIILALTLTPVLASSGRAQDRRAGRPRARQLADARAEASSTSRSSTLRSRHKTTAVAIGATIVGAGLLMRRLPRGASSCPSSRRATSGSAPRCRRRSRSSSRRSTSAACARYRCGCPKDGPCELPSDRAHPEITTVVSQLGRPDDGTDVSGFYNIELFAPLQPARRVARAA